ncbi:hypothetical protein P1J78_08870 [Psychromarinibacter sp. C21-152]|uniref:Holin-X, holin superfamily III n=1 Tax=Psychromarinibacter sediminicola TaxID=3033385 RepID=A0AAE3NRT5_9RHOB|nr:hypothetical protein [Psychromarinibacter sediminicola]MDF0600841.1 hypothetical protein [Psychromarinibacter sediminicola]
MIPGTANLAYAARRAALRSSLGLVGALCLCVGLGFLTVAAWIALTVAADALTAALVIGGAYAGLGLIVLVISRLARPRPPAPAAPAAAPAAQPALAPALVGVAAAFLQGVGAGLASRRRP